VFKRLILTLLFCLCSINFVFCDEEEDKKKPSEEVIVIGNPVIEGNVVDNYAGQKTVISEEQLDELNAQDIGTSLRRTPGVNISRYNPVGSFGGGEGGGVFIRGMGSSRPGSEIKTFIDGVPMYMSVWNHPLLDLMSIDSASSIEVYKSPQPQHFSNAFGIVNIKTKRMRTEGFQTKVKLATGSYHTYIGNFEHGGKVEKFDYYFGGGYRESDGHRIDSDGRMESLYGKVGYEFTDNWDLSLFSMASDTFAKDPGEVNGDPEEKEGIYRTRSLMAQGTLVNRYDFIEGEIKFYINKGEGDWFDQPTSTPGVREDLFNDFLYYGIKAKQAFHLWQGGEILTGFDWDYTEGDYDIKYSNNVNDRWEGHDFTIISPYLAISQLFGDKDSFHVIPSIGTRFYDNSDFEDEWSPHGGLLMGYKETELHFGYSRGIIYPGLEVVVMSEEIIPMLKESWKELEAERLDHYEAGISHSFRDFFSLDITFFYDDGKDRYILIPPPPPPPVYENVEDYTLKGIETTINVFPCDYLSLFGGYTYIDPDPEDLPYAPENTFSSGLNFMFFKSFMLSLDAEYIDNMYVYSQARKKETENTI